MLSQARNTALLWIQNLEFAKPEGMGPSKDYQQRLSTLAMICRSTFDVEPSYLANLCRKDNIRIMIEMLVLIASNPFTPRTSAAQTLVIRDHVLSYRLEPFITAASEISPVLDDIAIKSWPSHVKGNSWSQLPSKGGRWWKTTTSSSSHQTVHVNIIDGTLLVNGKTANKLPPEYLSHSSYQDVFGHNFSLKALPSSMAGMDYQAQFKDFMVHFKKAGDDLVIRIRHGETIHEYIPKSKLDSDIPASFLVKCNMWYQEVGYEGLINFRPKSDSLNFVKSPWQMSLGHDSGLVTGHLRKSKSGETIQVAMNPHSRTFMAIHDVLHVLEPEITRMSVFISPSEAYQSIQGLKASAKFSSRKAKSQFQTVKIITPTSASTAPLKAVSTRLLWTTS
ncbi:hypothetical protein FRC17_007232 [Serendipita sp. 399]|nr:hypothetical protein FRC17_007232 [Serendipita sp. 399]